VTSDDVIEVCVPVPRSDEPEVVVARKSPSISGRPVAILRNGWHSWDRLSAHLDRRVRDSYGASEVWLYDVPKTAAPPPEFFDEIASKVAGAITGFGN
jgi:hypothetical protein